MSFAPNSFIEDNSLIKYRQKEVEYKKILSFINKMANMGIENIYLTDVELQILSYFRPLNIKAQSQCYSIDDIAIHRIDDT